MIIDAWGRDNIYTIDENRRIKKWKYLHPIYVSGESLFRIVDEIDSLSWVKWYYDIKKDVYSKKKVLVIELPASRIEEMVYAIEQIGNNRDYEIYNADINIIQSFMVKNRLNFFDESSEEMNRDFIIPELNILNIKFIDGIRDIEINGEIFSNLEASMDYFFSHMDDCNIIISENGDTYFQKFFTLARRYGYSAYTALSRERSFNSYGRIHHRKSGFIIGGIPHIDARSSFMYSEGGLEGVVTISRLTDLPLFHSSRITPGTAVSSYEIRKAISRDIMIPLYKGDHEEMKNIEQFIESDKGGLILQPNPGVYEGVYEIDFSSMYPSIIVNYNLSMETINVKCKNFETLPYLNYRICKDRRGILSDILSDLLDLRLYYKSRKNEDQRFAMRDKVLKWLLLTSFGYTGYKNAKFGKIEVHEAITSIGRNILAESFQIAQEEGFEVIHGIVDSLWLKGDGDIKRVMERIEAFSRLKISLEGYYKWIAFLPSREGDGAINRYFGLMDNNVFKIRGIEMRRSDFPEICKKMQGEILDLYSDVNSISDFKFIYKKALKIYEKYKQNIIIGNVRDDDLMLSFVMTRFPEYYSVNSIRKKASEKSGGSVPGDRLNFFVKDEKKGLVELDNLEGKYDRNFYLRKLDLAWESISYPLRYAGVIYQKVIEEYD